MSKRPAARTAALAAALVLLTACESGQAGEAVTAPPPSGTPGASPAQPAAGAVVIVGGADNRFSPQDPVLERAADGSYAFQATVPDDSDLHTFQSDAAGFNSGAVAPGETVTVTFRAEPGRYEYYCLYHLADGMIGTITLL